jgi:hypothetical protein
MTAAFAAMIIGGAAQAAVVGPHSTVQSAAQSLDATEQVRRICQRKLRCTSFMRCHWDTTCYVTKDYPPEHGRR